MLAAAADLGVEIPESSNHLTKVGWGVSATVETSRVRVERPHGLPRFLRAEAHNLAVRGLTYFAVWVEDQPIGLLGFSDTVREGAADAVRRLREMGLEVAIVSGDRRESVESAAREAGISRVIAEVFPEGKVEEVRKLQAAGRKVAFVGDGINDGPALAAAHVGIALSTGTDVAKDASDVLVIGNNLRSIVDGLGLARRTYRAIAENIAWAFAYNILMIPMAIVGKIPPAAAAAAMTCSSMTVMGNALRLRRFKCSLPRPTAASPFEAGLPASSATQEGSASSVTSGRSGNLVNMAQEPSSTTVQVRGVGDFVKDEANRAMKGLLRGWEHQWDF